MKTTTSPRRPSRLALVACLSTMQACVDAPATHEEPTEAEDGVAIGKADGASASRWTYYAVLRADARGGVWLARLNQPDTKCADGKWATECYVAAIDWSRAGLSPEDATAADEAAHEARSILRGKLVRREADGAPVAVPTESWEGSSAADVGATALWSSGVAACAPACEGLPGTRLNKSGAHTTTYATLSVAGLGDDLASAGEDGVLLVGDVTKHGAKSDFEAKGAWTLRGHSEADTDRTDGPTCAADALATFPADELRIHVVDVGQGDAIVVQTPWHTKKSESLTVLVDAGASGDMPGSSPGGEVVVDYLHKLGLEDGDVLAGLVVTHAHDDHFGGVERVTESFGFERYTDPGYDGGSAAFRAARKAAKADVAAHDGEASVPAVSELVPRVFATTDLFGPAVDTTLLWASDKPSGSNATSTAGPAVNNTSIALALRYGGRQALLLGDIESPVEAALIAAHDEGEVDLASAFLKVAHHGSSRSTSTEFLDRVFPTKTAYRWAAISSGRRTFTGAYLPTEETIDRLHAALQPQHLLSTENRDGHKVVGTEHGDDHVLVRMKASGQVSACYLP